MTPYYADASVTLHHGDCLDVLRTLPDASVDAVVTDPPYGLEFMGKDWDSFAPRERKNASVWDGRRQAQDGWQDDAAARSGKGGGGPSYRSQHKGAKRCTLCGRRAFSGSPCECPEPQWVIEHRQEAPATMLAFQAWCTEWAAECYRVLKPGGHLLAFGGTRTWHRLACAVEDAGFEVRDSIAWLYGSGFSKSWNFKTMYAGKWCECREKPLPLSHAGDVDLPRVRGDVHEGTVPRGEGQDAVLLAPVQRSGKGSGVGDARPQGPRSLVAGGGSVSPSEDDRRAEPGMAGRRVHRAGEGLPHGSDASASESQGERLRGRALAGDGVADRSPGDAARGSAPHQQGPSGQPAGEPEAVPGPHEPLDDRARGGRVGCPRCGGLDPFYKGAGTGLKPAFEPIVVARKPLAGTVAANVLAHGTGALNVDGCRVGTDTSRGDRYNGKAPLGGGDIAIAGSRPEPWEVPAGRWPANVVLDREMAAALDEQSGELHTQDPRTRQGSSQVVGVTPFTAGNAPCYDDEPGTGASRFFYVAKADASERVRVDGIAHPTVKPLALMRWLVRLVTPPGGTVLEPFAGSGTTVEACILEGFRCIAVEREADYLPLILQRIHRRRDPVQAVRGAGEDGGLFDLLDGGAA